MIENNSYSALKLFNFEHEELPKLLDPLFPKIGLASSDTGKSTLLRQLHIIEFKLNYNIEMIKEKIVK